MTLYLKLNSDKTDVLLEGTKTTLAKLDSFSLTIDNSIVPPSPRSSLTVLYSSKHTSIISLSLHMSIYAISIAYAHLLHLTPLLFPYMPWLTIATLSSLVFLTTFNWSEFSCPYHYHNLSMEHITLVLQQLHWLPVKYCVHFKILLLPLRLFIT